MEAKVVPTFEGLVFSTFGFEILKSQFELFYGFMGFPGTSREFGINILKPRRLMNYPGRKFLNTPADKTKTALYQKPELHFFNKPNGLVIIFRMKVMA